MTYQTVAASAAATVGAVYFVGPGAVFSRVALRTVETELDGPTHRVADLDALRFARMSETGAVRPAYMVVVHESCAAALLTALEQAADFLPTTRIAIAFEDETTVRAQFGDICNALLERRVSLLPMNTNVTNWVRLLQVIQSGGHYVPPEILQASAERGADEANAAVVPPSGAEVPDAPPSPPQSAAHRRTEARGRPARSPEPATSHVSQAAAQHGTQHGVQNSASGRPLSAGAPGSEPSGAGRLTPREAEVLEMAAAGRPNKTIAGELDLSEHTVKLYMHRIIGKLGVTNRTEAAVWFHRNSGHA